MSRVIFTNQPTPPEVNTGRADVACFIGLVRRLDGAVLPAASVSWLRSLGFGAMQIASVTNVPVLLESWAMFKTLFDPGGDALSAGTDYLSAAVNSFFAQGGKRCYVVRTGDPLAASDDAVVKAKQLAAILPNPAYSASDAATRTGVCTLAVLEEVSFVATPDLPALCASAPSAVAGQVPFVPTGPEQFVECSQADMTPPQYRVYAAAAPRLTPSDYTRWAASLAAILQFVVSGSRRNELNLREMQMVAAFPLPQELDTASASENPSAEELAQDIQDIIRAQMPEFPEGDGVVPAGNISTAFLQLGYPWLKTTGSHVLTESLEPPDGVLVGLLARNALKRGAFHSATKVVPSGVYDVWPTLPTPDTTSSSKPLVWDNVTPKPLIERLSLFGFTPSGLRLLSDVTAYPGETYRSGAVNRLVNVICRAARMTGESSVFEQNGPALWGRVQRTLQNLMTRLYTLNALAGSSVTDAFNVRCDQSTMTQNDLDNGRLLADVTFTAASTIETINVTLAMQTTGTSVQQITASSMGVS